MAGVGITREVHVARKEYPCSAPGRPCARRIYRGQPYTLISTPPHTAPLNAPGWTNQRACSSCEPIAHEVLSAPQPCPVDRGDLQCELPLGHYPLTDHQYPIGLF